MRPPPVRVSSAIAATVVLARLKHPARRATTKHWRVKGAILALLFSVFLLAFSLIVVAILPRISTPEAPFTPAPAGLYAVFSNGTKVPVVYFDAHGHSLVIDDKGPVRIEGEFHISR